MTRRACQCGNAVASLSAYDIEEMGMPIIALLRIAGGGVAIDAARVRQHRIHLAPRDEAFGAKCCADGESPLDRGEEGQAYADAERLSAIHRPTVTPSAWGAIVKTCSIDRG